MPRRFRNSREEDLYWEWQEERCECAKDLKCEFCEEREENQKRQEAEIARRIAAEMLAQDSSLRVAEEAAAKRETPWHREVMEIRRLMQENFNADSHEKKVKAVSDLFQYLYMECVDFLAAQPGFRNKILLKMEEFSGAPELTRDIKSLYETLEKIKTFEGYVA